MCGNWCGAFLAKMRQYRPRCIRGLPRHGREAPADAASRLLFDVFAVTDLRNAPPYLSFRLAEKKDSAAPGGRKKRAPNAGKACSMFDPCNRGHRTCCTSGLKSIPAGPYFRESSLTLAALPGQENGLPRRLAPPRNDGGGKQGARTVNAASRLPPHFARRAAAWCVVRSRSEGPGSVSGMRGDQDRPHSDSGDPGSAHRLPACAWSPEDTSSGRLSLEKQAAAACGRKRQLAFSAAAPFAGRRGAGPQMAMRQGGRTVSFPDGKEMGLDCAGRFQRTRKGKNGLPRRICGLPCHDGRGTEKNGPFFHSISP